jgi:hypothetical protein
MRECTHSEAREFAFLKTWWNHTTFNPPYYLPSQNHSIIENNLSSSSPTPCAGEYEEELSQLPINLVLFLPKPFVVVEIDCHYSKTVSLALAKKETRRIVATMTALRLSTASLCRVLLLVVVATSIVLVKAYDVAPPYDPHARRYRHHHDPYNQYDDHNSLNNNVPPIDHFTQHHPQRSKFHYGYDNDNFHNDDDGDDDDDHYNNIWEAAQHQKRTPPPPPKTNIPPIHQYAAETSANRAIHPVKSIWDTSAPVLVEGSSLQTWGFESMDVKRVQVLLRAPPPPTTEPARGGTSSTLGSTSRSSSNAAVAGPPTTTGSSSSSPLVFQASVDVWHGPDTTPQRMAVYMEDNQHHNDYPQDNDDDDDNDYYYDDDDDDNDDGYENDYMSSCSSSSSSSTPFTAIIETPGGYNTIAIRNTANSMDHPVLACVEADHHSVVMDASAKNYNDNNMNPSSGGGSGGSSSSSAYYYNSQRRTNEPNYRQQQKATSSSSSSPGPSVPAGSALQDVTNRLTATSVPHQVDGGGDATAYTFELAHNIASVQVLLSTDYQRPLQARIELALIEEDISINDDEYMGGGYQQHQYHTDRYYDDHRPYDSYTVPSIPKPPRILKRSIIEVVSEDAMNRPFFAVLETPRNRLLEASYRQTENNNIDKGYENHDVLEDQQYGTNHHRLKQKHSRRRRKTQRPKKLTIQMRVLNLSPSYDGFPIYACVEPYVIDTETSTSTTPTNNRRRRKRQQGNRRNSSSSFDDDDDDDSSTTSSRWTTGGENTNHDYEVQKKKNKNDRTGAGDDNVHNPQQEILTEKDFPSSSTTASAREFKNKNIPPFGGSGSSSNMKGNNSNKNYYNATIVDIELS